MNLKLLSTEFLKQLQVAASKLRSLDIILNQIGKTSGITKQQLNKLAASAFDAADKYGISAEEYLSAAQKAIDSGYKNIADISELSATLKAAAGVNDVLAVKYISAADKAFRMNGSVTELTKSLDGAYNITKNNTVSMSELANGFASVADYAALAGMQADETTAAIATLITTAGMSGEEAGNALKEILAGLQHMTDTVNDSASSIKAPMQILEDLAESYTDFQRNNTLGSVPSEMSGIIRNSDALNTFLDNFATYEKFLSEYYSGTASISEDAQKNVQSLDGALKRLSSTWTDTVGNIVNSDEAIAAVNGLNELLGIVNKTTDALGPLGSIGLSAGIAGVSAFVKNFA
ncbi:MAG: phage tail tape measure protein [Bacteroides sp.]